VGVAVDVERGRANCDKKKQKKANILPNKNSAKHSALLFALHHQQALHSS
jgi:hypothetical protein